MGPVAVFAAMLLLFAAPLMRGGNRQVALLVLEAIALAFLLILWLGTISGKERQALSWSQVSPSTLLVTFLVLSPVWLALVYLLPVPAAFWSGTSARDIYVPLLRDAGLSVAEGLPLSLVPDATRASLLAGLPLVAAFVAGYQAKLSQLKLLLGLIVALAFAQVMLGLLQIAGGVNSALFFGMAADRPIGTFANPNHFANYLAMALAAYVWLAWQSLLRPRPRWHDNPAARLASRHSLAIWVAGGVVLVLGILMSRSRGAALTGLPVGMLAIGLALSSGNRDHSWRFTVALAGGVLAGAVALVGLGSVLARFELGGMSDSALYRGLLASTTLDGAKAFWPWGAGWGTYAAVYPRFQPLGLEGIADYAHHDYAQMLFEGGIFAVMLALAFAWLAAARAVLLAQTALRHHGFTLEEMASALCGLGLLGLLLHSLLEFNMHIPANAIVGALLAGVYLRPLRARTRQS
jgi:O-antigen ligase/polysaccharide polymerase Wzy-like membrane protein